MAAFTLGAHIGQQNMSMDELRKTWTRLDALGIDWISVWDHLYEAPPAGGTIDHFEAVSTLGALAADTSHARIGCLVFYVGYRNPALLAKAASTLDHISGGRFELGIGAGWHEWEAKAYGYDFPALGKRFDMLEEACEVISSMLANDRTDFDGNWFRTVDASNLPMPIQPKLPLWLGGVGEKRTLPLCARYADGWNAAYIPAGEFGRLSGILDDRCLDVGRDPASIKRTINVQFGVGLDQSAVDRSVSTLRESWGPMADRTMRGTLVGTPDQVVEQVAAYKDAGADGLNVALRAPFDLEALEGFLEAAGPLRMPDTKDAL